MKVIPFIGLGTWQLTGKQCITTVSNALEIGYTHIDTAEMYGNEKEVGQALSGQRDKVFITSKVWMNHYTDIRTACKNTCDRLQTNHLDLYLLHWPDSTQDLENIVIQMKELQDEGMISHFGVSNFTIKHLQDIIPWCQKHDLEIFANQVEFHPLLHQTQLHSFCKENNIQLCAYSPLAHGNILDNKVLTDIAKKHGVTSGQVSLSWILSQDIVVLPKASSNKHLEQNLSSQDVRLDPEDIQRINDIKETKRFINPDFAEF